MFIFKLRCWCCYIIIIVCNFSIHLKCFIKRTRTRNKKQIVNRITHYLLFRTNGTDSSSLCFVPPFGSVLLSSESWSTDGERTNLKMGRSPFERINEAGRAADVVIPLDVVPAFMLLVLLLLEVFVLAVLLMGLCGGRFSLMKSIRIGTSCLMETRFSVFMLPECFRIESRRIIIGEEAIEGHALTDMYENSEISIRNKMKKWIANGILRTDLTRVSAVQFEDVAIDRAEFTRKRNPQNKNMWTCKMKMKRAWDVIKTQKTNWLVVYLTKRATNSTLS